MRIVNQKRTASIELGNYDLFVDDNAVAAQSANCTGRYKVLGEYDSEERAMEVLKKIHSDYKYYRFDVYEMPT